MTPLRVAKRENHQDIVEYLIAQGADSSDLLKVRFQSVLTIVCSVYGLLEPTIVVGVQWCSGLIKHFSDLGCRILSCQIMSETIDTHKFNKHIL